MQNYLVSISELYKKKTILIQFIIYFILAVICSKLIISSAYNLLIFLCGPFIFLFFLKKNINLIITFFIMVCYINYFIYWYKLPRFLTWYIEIYAIALLFSIIYFVILKRENVPDLKFFFILFSLILIIHLFSFYLNKQIVLRLLMAGRKYYIYFLIFLGIIILPGNKKLYEKLIKVIVFTVFIQIPISIFQYFIFRRADFMGGLFGKNSSGTISTLGVGFGFLGYYLYKYYKKKKIFLFSGIGMIIPLIFAESKFGMIFLPIAYIYNILIEKKYYLKKISLLLFLLPLYILSFLVFDYVNSHNPDYHPHMYRTLKDPFYLFKLSSRKSLENIDPIIRESGYALPMMSRFASIPFSFNFIKKTNRVFLLGYGPGEASQDPYLPGKLVNLGFFRTFIVISLLEWGILGTSIWFLLFFYLFIINIKCLKYFQKQTYNSLWKAFCYFSNIQMIIFLSEFVYSRSFLLEYKGIFFWITNGLIFWFYLNYIRPKKIRKLLSNS